MYLQCRRRNISDTQKKRDYIITFCGIKDAQVTGKRKADSSEVEFNTEKKKNLSVVMENISVNEEITLDLKKRIQNTNEIAERCFQILNRAEIGYDLKDDILRTAD